MIFCWSYGIINNVKRQEHIEKKYRVYVKMGVMDQVEQRLFLHRHEERKRGSRYDNYWEQMGASGKERKV